MRGMNFKFWVISFDWFLLLFKESELKVFGRFGENNRFLNRVSFLTLEKVRKR